uniref:Uncharacterized protein n=1 Tax=Anguilla anguilla TaxID=7936 RepID=A0A0E9PM43_ANGAN
MLMIKQLFLFR